MTQPLHSRPPRVLSRGEKVQLTDPKGRMHTFVLAPGEHFHTNKGLISHDDIIGRTEGIIVANTGGIDFQVFRPRYEDFVLSMPRGAAVVYPKDSGLIVTLGDIFPGATVVEAGVGSGALSMALLRAVGSEGSVHSFELREEFATIAAGNIADFFDGEPENWSVTVGDLAETLPQTFGPGSVDRVVLDMLTPGTSRRGQRSPDTRWNRHRIRGHRSAASRFVEALRASGKFAEPESMEAMVRGWHVDGLSPFAPTTG